MGMMTMTVAVLTMVSFVPLDAVPETPNCEDKDPNTPCCPLEERWNILIPDAWLDCVNLVTDDPRGARFA